MSKRDPMVDPRPGDELHDYYHRGNQYASFTLSRWRAHWAPPRHRIGYVTRTA